MSYTGNFDTAKIYLNTGLNERAKEYLLKVLDAVPEEERGAANAIYLKSLVLLARIQLEAGDPERCAAYVEKGLSIKPDHADLSFLKALMLWDNRRYDEMFLALMDYLGALIHAEAARYEYEYAGQQVVAEVVYKLLPEAYAKAAARQELAAAIAAMAARTDNEMIVAVNKVLQEVKKNEQGS